MTGMSDSDMMANYSQSDMAEMQQQYQDIRGAFRDPNQILGEGAGPGPDPKKQLADLKALVQKPENAAALGNDQKTELLGKISDLQKLIGKRGTDPNDLEDQISQLSDEISTTIEEAKQNRSDQMDSFKNAVQTLLDNVHSSRLASDKKTDLTNQLNAVKDQLKDKNVSLDTIQSTLDDLQKAFNRDMNMDKLMNKFGELSSHIPAQGGSWQRTMDLAHKVNAAMESGDWSEVKTFLADMRDNHNNEANDMIQQFVGTLYYGPANQNEDNLDQLLALIPADVRGLMSQAALANTGEQNSGDNLDNDTHKMQVCYYGTPSATADRLTRGRIDSALDNLDDPNATSGYLEGPSPTTTTTGH